MSKDMCCRNRPNFNTDSGLTPTGPGPAGERPGSARERNAAGSPGASRPALRRFFAPGTPASAAPSPGGSGGPPADVDELAAPLGRPGRAAGGAAVGVAAPAAGVETEAFNQAGAAASTDVEPVRRGRRRVGRRVDVLTAAARANPSTPLPDGFAATWR